MPSGGYGSGCNGTQQQDWTFSGGAGSYNTIQNGYGLCLAAEDGGSNQSNTDGDTVAVFDCNPGNSDEEWEPEVAFDDSGAMYVYLINQSYGLVLDATDDCCWNPSMNGDRVQLWQKSGAWGTANQDWGIGNPA